MILGVGEDVLVLPGGVGCHHCSAHQLDSPSRDDVKVRIVPLALMSVLRIGVLEYSLASARRTSFFTIWSWLLPHCYRRQRHRRHRSRPRQRKLLMRKGIADGGQVLGRVRRLVPFLGQCSSVRIVASSLTDRLLRARGILRGSLKRDDDSLR